MKVQEKAKYGNRRNSDTESKVVTSSRSSKSKNYRENINGLETSRSNKDVLCAECPPVNNKQAMDINETFSVKQDEI